MTVIYKYLDCGDLHMGFARVRLAKKDAAKGENYDKIYIPGIGPKKKKTLLLHFKGISKMKAARTEKIASLPGMTQKLAEKLIQALRNMV